MDDDYEWYYQHFCEAMGLPLSWDSLTEFLIFLNFRIRDLRSEEVAEARASKRLPLLNSPHRATIFKMYKSRRYSLWGKIKNTPKKLVFRFMYKMLELVEVTGIWLSTL